MRGPRSSRLEDFDPNASDPNDSDFEENPSSPPRRSSKNKNKKSTPARRRTQKRSRRNYSDDDIIDDDDDISEDEESFASASDASEDEPPEVNASGRPARSAAKKKVKYEESAEEDIEDELIAESIEKNAGDKRKQQHSLIVKFSVPSLFQNTRSTRARSTRAGSKSVQPEPNVRTRRSARLSEDRDEPLQELGNARRARSVRSATRSHSPQRRLGRPAQGRKAPMKRPSTIMEASQEASGHSAQSPDPLQPKEETHDEVQVSQAASVTSEIRYEGQDIEDAQSGEAVVQESEHEQQGEEEQDEEEQGEEEQGEEEQGEEEQGEEDEDSDEGPVRRGRTRSQRVSESQNSASTQPSSAQSAVPAQSASTTAATSASVLPSVSTTQKKANPTKKSRKRKPDVPDGFIYIPRARRVPQRELNALTRGFQQQATTRSATKGSQKRRADDSSDDFDPDNDKHESDDDDDLESNRPPSKRQKSSGDESTTRKRSTRKSSQRSRRNSASEDEDQLDIDELAEEAADLENEQRRSRRTRASRNDGVVEYQHKPNLRTRDTNKSYTIMSLKEVLDKDEREVEEAGVATPTQAKRKGAGGAWRPLHTVAGPFGGIGGGDPLIGFYPQQDNVYDLYSSNGYDPGTSNHREILGELDSDSSDDEANQSGQRGPHEADAATGSAAVSGPVGLLPPTAPAHGVDKGSRGGPANLGRIDKGSSNADVNPISVDNDVNFESVGGLDNHINQLKEMVTLPLLYPEIFQKFKITPPRGVLFHGPPGTGKTLLARALSNAVSANGKKVTFYMRKGADALSKWIGEAERQLRMLFEDARKNQPSIIFFDEIDGLAPVRSSKSEQSLASIVATLLALMDGMDDRGQVVIIGATNRPDNVDPALRRPGRFDREFYFPLPDVTARRSIIDIHTKNWNPSLPDDFKNQLAELTKGYGGADLRALCTEAAVNAVQGTFPQIYQSNKKLVIDTDKIKVSAKDFMISVNKIVPSSQRSTSFGGAPLQKATAPLLKQQLEDIVRIIDDVVPPPKKATALEEAQYDDRDDDFGFERENVKRDFDQVRVFRPRLLIRGYEGMGQQEIGAALLHKFENMHVQSFDLPSLLGDKDKSAEATLVQLFKEVRTHKPSVIYIPHVDVWYETVGQGVVSIFTSLLRTMPANEPVLVLGTMEQHDDNDKPNPAMLKDLFGFSLKNQYELKRPNEESRKEYFENVISYIRKPPKQFPDANRKKRKFDTLEEAPEVIIPPKPPTKADLKAIKRSDRHTLNLLKSNINHIMSEIRRKYRNFFKSTIPDSEILYLYREENPRILTSDVPLEQRQGEYRPYEIAYDRKGVKGLLETATGKFYYNLNFGQIEERLANGYYKRPRDFLQDVRSVAKDARTSGDRERILKTSEVYTNVEVDIAWLEEMRPDLVAQCEAVYRREQQRLRELQEEEKQKAAEEGRPVAKITANIPPPHVDPFTESESTGPIVLGVPHDEPQHIPPITPSYPVGPSSLSNGISSSDIAGSHHRQSNGSAGYGDDDTNRGDSQDQDSQHRDKRQKLLEENQQSAPNTQTFNRSQKSGHTQMAPNTQPGDYQNSASTTTSGQKTSDRSWNTQSTVNGNAPGQHPDFASGPAQSGGSQIPDTQEPFASSQLSNSQQSQSSQSHLSAHAMPTARQEPKINSLLNSNEQQPEPLLIIDEELLTQFHKQLVHRSSGLSVEQLEQVNAAMMAAIWKERGDWNRIRVMHTASSAFNDTIRDIEEMQKVLPPSQEKHGKQ